MRFLEMRRRNKQVALSTGNQRISRTREPCFLGNMFSFLLNSRQTGAAMSERLYLLSGPPLAPFILPSVPEALQKGVSKYVHNEIVSTSDKHSSNNNNNSSECALQIKIALRPLARETLRHGCEWERVVPLITCPGYE